MNAKCAECQGACCSFRKSNIVLTGLSEPVSEVVKGQGKDLLRKDGKVPNMRWFERDGALVFDCQHRSETGKCRIYKNRPGLCRTFRCDVLLGIQTVEEFKAEHKPTRGPQGREVTKQVWATLKSSGRN